MHISNMYIVTYYHTLSISHKLETGGVGTKGGGGGKRGKLVVGNTLLLRSATVTGPRGNSMCMSSVPWRPERGSTKHFSTQKGVAQWLTLLLHHQRWLRHVRGPPPPRAPLRPPDNEYVVFKRFGTPAICGNRCSSCFLAMWPRGRGRASLATP